MIRRPQTETLSGGPELTPLIDIVFIVIVFLLLTANVQVLSLPVDIPDTDSQISKATPTKKPLTIAIRSSEPYWVTDDSETGIQRYGNWLNFKASLLAHLDNPDTSLLIAPESQASAGHLLQLLALLNERAFTDVQILMEPKAKAH